MKFKLRFVLLALLAGLIAMGCEVTAEKIETWKGTQKGPKKLAGTMIDPGVDMSLRVKAVQALVDIEEVDLLREAFPKMEKADSDALINAVAPELGKEASKDGGIQEKSLDQSQIRAKDGLFIILDFAGDASRDSVVKPLVDWCSKGNYNIRAEAGLYNAQAIAKKIGGPAAMGMADALVLEQRAIEPISKIIADIKDEAAVNNASAKLAERMRKQVKSIGEKHLVAGAIIGKEPMADLFLDLATDKNLTAELQRFALRAYSQSLTNGSIEATDKQITRLFELAENTEFDQFQREETYMTIAQGGSEKHTERVAKLLSSESFFWRLVGMRCLLRMDGENWIKKALESEGLAEDKDEVSEVIVWTARFPKLKDKLRELAEKGSPFARGVAVYALGAAGDAKKDAALLEKLIQDKTKLSSGFDHKTLGEAAAASIEALKKG